VLEEVGRGAMGRVVRAYDPKLEREVALKEVRASVLDAETTRRLVTEARAMAKVSHPNVVAVFDVEEATSGELVLVMEYVRGTTLREWFGESLRDWRAVVRTFVAAGRGLAAAHDAGLLHRDFKPTNVLVAGDGTVKVTDFGLAKDTAVGSTSEAHGGASGSGDDSLTGVGVVMGTPRYMAPEQHRGDSLTAAADQYAFCVSLWEALCGAPPFAGADLDAIAHNKQGGPPRWPESSTPRPVADAVRRGLSPDAAARWPSMNALIAALEWDPARRRNLQLAALGAVVVVGGGVALASRAGQLPDARCGGARDGLAEVWDETRRTEVQAAISGTGAPYAASVWDRTRADLDAYAESWVAMHRDSCEASTVRGEQSAAVMDLRMACLHRAATDLQAVVRELAHADAELVGRAYQLTAGLPQLQRCADVEALQAEVEPPLPQEAPAVEEVRLRVAEAKAARDAGRLAAAKERIDEAKAVLERVSYIPVHTEVMLEDAAIEDKKGDYPASEVALVSALRLATSARQWRELGDAARGLVSVVGFRQQRPDAGLVYLGIAEAAAEGDLLREGAVAHALADVRQVQGRLDEAAAGHRRAAALREGALGPDHVLVGTSHNSLGRVMYAQGRFEEAEAEFRWVLAHRLRTLGPEHPIATVARNNLGVSLNVMGRYDEARDELQQTLDARTRLLGSDHPETAATRGNLASALENLGQYEEAEVLQRESLRQLERTLGADHPDVGGIRANLSSTLISLGRYAEAETEARGAVSAFEATLGPDNPGTAMMRGLLANALVAQGKLAEAEVQQRRALEAREAALDPGHKDIAGSRFGLGSILLELDRPDEALVFAEQAWNHDQGDGVPVETRAKSAALLARALWAADKDPADRRRAHELAEAALVDYLAAGEQHRETADWLRGWIAEHPVP
jgi:serine/threonine-protein kinase